MKLDEIELRFNNRQHGWPIYNSNGRSVAVESFECAAIRYIPKLLAVAKAAKQYCDTGDIETGDC